MRSLERGPLKHQRAGFEPVKTISEKLLPDGRRRVIVELAADEKLLPIKDRSYYRLGEPLDGDVVGGHILGSAREVSWFPIEQKWV